MDILEGNLDARFGFLTWLLEIEQGVLGSLHPVARARRAVLEEMCRRPYLSMKADDLMRSPWRSPVLGGLPAPEDTAPPRR